MARAGPPLKIGERVARITPVARAPLEALLTSLNLGVQHNIDPDAENLVAVATFSYTPPSGQPQQVATLPEVSLSWTFCSLRFLAA